MRGKIGMIITVNGDTENSAKVVKDPRLLIVEQNTKIGIEKTRKLKNRNIVHLKL